MFFNRRGHQLLGSKCPVAQGGCHLSRPMSARVTGSRKDEGIVLLKPRVAINTYKMHQTLFNVAKDEVMASSVLQYCLS